MESVRAVKDPASVSVVAIGFGTAVAMWAVGYVGRLPAILLPSPLLLFLMLVCLFGGGLVLGRYAGLGWRAGALAGAVSGLLNLLVLGSFLTGGSGDGVVPSVMIWLPGSILLAALLVAFGSGVGAQFLRREPLCLDWSGALVKVGIAAAMLLLAVGGLVTSAGAGLAVVDWPNTFGYNMFLYPFSRMTGGIYYEHAHRLFGALVGLTTLVLALQLQIRERRRWVRRIGWLAFAMVVVQGILGGLRVTGDFTLSTDAAEMRPSVALAMVHGIFGQIFFATLVALGAFTSTAWSRRDGGERSVPAVERLLGVALIALIFGQLALGAAVRHFDALLIPHILVGVAVVAPLAVHVGFRAWGKSAGVRALEWLGLALVAAAAFQVLLGLVAFAFRTVAQNSPGSLPVDIAITTAHQWFGAVVLGVAVVLVCWIHRPADHPD